MWRLFAPGLYIQRLTSHSSKPVNARFRNLGYPGTFQVEETPIARTDTFGANCPFGKISFAFQVKTGRKSDARR